MLEKFEELTAFVNKKVAEVDKKEAKVKAMQYRSRVSSYSNGTRLLLLKIAENEQLTLRECRKLLSGLHMTKEESRRLLWRLHKDKIITIFGDKVRITLTKSLILRKDYHEIIKEFQDNTFSKNPSTANKVFGSLND